MNFKDMKMIEKLKDVSIILQYLYTGEKISYRDLGSKDIMEIYMENDLEVYCRRDKDGSETVLNFTNELTAKFIVNELVPRLEMMKPERYMHLKTRWEEIKKSTESSYALTAMSYYVKGN